MLVLNQEMLWDTNQNTWNTWKISLFLSSHSLHNILIIHHSLQADWKWNFNEIKWKVKSDLQNERSNEWMNCIKMLRKKAQSINSFSFCNTNLNVKHVVLIWTLKLNSWLLTFNSLTRYVCLYSMYSMYTCCTWGWKVESKHIKEENPTTAMLCLMSASFA